MPTPSTCAEQMMVKHAEMAALWKAAKPDQTAIQAKQKELNALRDQMQEKMTAFGLEAKKICPGFSMGMGMGMGMSDCGMGPGMGQGPAWVRPAWAWAVAPVVVRAPELCRRRLLLPPNSQSCINTLELKGRSGPSAIPRLHAESAAKGDENGTDHTHYYHYFAGGGLPYLAHSQSWGYGPVVSWGRS